MSRGKKKRRYLKNGRRKYPNLLHVRGEPWVIAFKHKVLDEFLHDDDNYPTLGLCDPSDKIIYIKTGQTRLETLATFLHEAVHAWEEENGQDVPHVWIDTLDTIFAEILLENPNIIKKILQ